MTTPVDPEPDSDDPSEPDPPGGHPTRAVDVLPLIDKEIA